MKDFDFDEIDKAIKKELGDDKKPAPIPAAPKPATPPTPRASIKPRGHYIDFITSRPTPKPKPTPPPTKTAVVKTTTFVQEQVGIIAETPAPHPQPLAPIPARTPAPAAQEPATPTPEPAPTAKSPFIETAHIKKRPLSPDVPSDSERAIRSSKNVYSSRSPLVSRPEKVTKAEKPQKAPKKSRRFDWFTALIIFLIVLFGSAIGFILYILFTQ